MTQRLLMATWVLIGLAGCASDPQSATRAAYDNYWGCVSTAVRPYIDQRQLSSHEAAMRAQAACNATYQQYRSTQIGVVRGTVASDNYDLADRLGAQQALVWRRRATRALDDYVHRTRAGS